MPFVFRVSIFIFFDKKKKRKRERRCKKIKLGVVKLEPLAILALKLYCLGLKFDGPSSPVLYF